MKRWFCALIALALLISCPAVAQEATDAQTALGSITAAEVVTADSTEPAPTGEASTSPEADDTEVPPASTPEPAPITIAFEDGFSLELPGDWLHYEVSDEMAQKGVLYCLSDAAAERWLYIQSWITDCADIDALSALITETSNPQTSGVYDFNGTPFVVYDLTEGDVSCCAALLNGRVLNFVFTPQSDADFMVTAAQIIGTFTVL